LADNAEADPLVEYSIKDLFGDRDLSFILDESEPTVLTGANGSGKSTVLRTIDAFSAGQWELLDKIPFSELRLHFKSGKSVRLKRDSKGLTFSASGHKSWTWPGPRVQRGQLRQGERAYMAARRHRLLDERYRGVLSATAVAELEYEYAMLTHQEQAVLWKDIPDWISGFQSRLPVLYVTDQRLVLEPLSDQRRPTRQAEVSTWQAVDQAVEQVQALMSAALSDYAAESQRLDRDFPQRVVAAMSEGVKITDSALQDQLAENDFEAKLLQRVGLLPEDVAPQTFTDFQGDAVKPVITTFAENTARKLAVLSPLRERLSLFVDFLSQHYRPKRIFLDPKFGIRIRVGDELISPSQLSSGEKQILVLAHQILFRAEPGTLILIDEPELSLHVLWQDTFIDDISRMGAVRNLRFLLATHSPTLIGGRDDLRRSLDIG